MRFFLFFLVLFVFNTATQAQTYTIADSLFNKADSAFRATEYEKAAYLFYQCAKSESKCSPVRYDDLLFEFINAATCFKAIGNDSMMLTVHKECIGFYEREKKTCYTLRSLYELSNYLITNNKIKDAQLLVNKLSAYSLSCKDSSSIAKSYLLKANISAVENNQTDLLKHYESALSYFPVNDYENICKLHLLVAEFNAAKQVSVQAEMYFNKAKQVANISNDEELQVFVLQAQSQALLNEKSFIPKQLVDSLSFFYSNFNDHEGLAFIHILNANNFNIKFSLDSALIEYQVAKSIFEKINNIEEQISSSINIADILKQKGAYDYALVELTAAAETCKAYGLNTALFKVSSALGNIYIAQGKYDVAISCYEGLLNQKENSNTKEFAHIYNNIGGVYTEWGEYDKAFEYYNKALQIFKNNSLSRDYAITLSNIGAIQELNIQHEMALLNYNEALQIFKSIQDLAKSATVLNNIGGIYYYLNQNTKALEYYTEALNYSKFVDNKIEYSIGVR
ncbi:MAG: tetratricopeptide repeat protein [Bacteroidales bacterium]|nr:tetratricopeptide repeat protein [Bacteroidales bacterium]